MDSSDAAPKAPLPNAEATTSSHQSEDSGNEPIAKAGDNTSSTERGGNAKDTSEGTSSTVTKQNDGGFMERFKKMKAEKEKKKREEEAAEVAKVREAKRLAKEKRKQEDSASGRGKKAKKGDKETSASPAWQAYLDEVKMYENQTCKEYKGFPLVK